MRAGQRRGRMAVYGLLSGLLLMLGCANMHLDYVAGSLDRWGTVSLSGATLIEPDPRFELDLDLSGEEIFRRNRIEGFSNISQFDSLDAQISVQAELVANLLNQMSSTTDPGLLKQLRTQLQAAAFKGLLGSLPEEQQALLAPVLGTLNKRAGIDQQDDDTGATGTLATGSQSAVPAAASDAGLGLAQAAAEQLAMIRAKQTEAQVALADFKDAIAKAEAVRAKAEGTPPDPSDTAATQEYQQAVATLEAEGKRKREAAARVTAAVGDALTAAKLVGSYARDGADKAAGAVAAAQAKFATLPAEVRIEGQATLEQFSGATEAANAVLGKANTLKAQATETLNRLPGVTGVKDNKPDPDGTPAARLALLDPILAATQEGTPIAAPPLVAELEKAVNQARAASSVAGVTLSGPQKPAAPNAPQKILTAPDIDPKRRLSLARADRLGLRDFQANPDVNPELNLRQLLLLSASDKMTLEMLRWLTYPRDNAPNKKVYLCMASVNVVPGKWTYKGYNAQVDLYMTLGNLGKSGRVYVPYPPQEPTVFSVFPFVDGQVLNLRTSRRQMFTTAMQLAVSGYPAAAKVFLDYARSRQQDIETLTGLNTVTSYSNGRHLGFTFSPRVVAQQDPTSLNTSPAFNLQPQTFPVMIMVVVDERSYQTTSKEARRSVADARQAFAQQPRIPVDKERKLSEVAPWSKADGDPITYEEAIEEGLDQQTEATHCVWHQTHRWMRAPDLAADNYLLGRTISDALTPRLTETEVIGRARRLDLARAEYEVNAKKPLTEEKQQYRNKHKYELRALRNRTTYLAGHGLGTTAVFALPGFEVPKNTADFEISVEPKTAWLDQPNTLFITAKQGTPFSGGFAVSIGGRSVNATRLSPTVLRVVMPPWVADVDRAALADPDLNALRSADVVVTNGAHTASAEVTFAYHSNLPPPRERDESARRRASFAGGALQIDPRSTNESDQIVRIALSRPIAGVQSAVIRIHPTGGQNQATTKPVVLKAVVGENGQVVAQDPLRRTVKNNVVEWAPADAGAFENPAVEVQRVELELTLDSGSRLVMDVAGRLIIKR